MYRLGKTYSVYDCQVRDQEDEKVAKKFMA